MRKKRFVGDEILDIFSTNISYFKLISNKISYAYLISRVKELNKNFSSPAMNIYSDGSGPSAKFQMWLWWCGVAA